MNAPAYDPHDPDAVPYLGLLASRAPDRLRMAALLQTLAVSHGATARVEAGGWRGARCVRVEINAPGGLFVGVDIDGGSTRPGAYVVPWGVRLAPSAAGVCLAPSFGDVNPHHGQKATHVAHGFEALYWEIHRGLKAAADGTAYARGAA